MRRLCRHNRDLPLLTLNLHEFGTHERRSCGVIDGQRRGAWGDLYILSYDVFLDVPSVAAIDIFLTLPPMTPKDVTADWSGSNL